MAETTTHLVTSDKKGNVVSYTFTIESTGGSGLLVPGWGFLLNNELTDFNFTPTVEPNRPEGGKRPRSSMAPTIVLKHKKPFLALGSPGGSTIITTVLQILFDRVDQGMTLPQAIADPRASQRNAVEHRRRAGVPLEPAADAAGGEGPPVHERGRDRRRDGDRVPRRRRRARGGRARAARHRERDGGEALAHQCATACAETSLRAAAAIASASMPAAASSSAGLPEPGISRTARCSKASSSPASAESTVSPSPPSGQ